ASYARSAPRLGEDPYDVRSESGLVLADRLACYGRSDVTAIRCLSVCVSLFGEQAEGGEGGAAVVAPGGGDGGGGVELEDARGGGPDGGRLAASDGAPQELHDGGERALGGRVDVPGGEGAEQVDEVEAVDSAEADVLAGDDGALELVEPA